MPRDTFDFLEDVGRKIEAASRRIPEEETPFMFAIGSKVQVVGLGGDREGTCGTIVGEARFKYAVGDWVLNWIVRFPSSSEDQYLHPNWLRKE